MAYQLWVPKKKKKCKQKWVMEKQVNVLPHHVNDTKQMEGLYLL